MAVFSNTDLRIYKITIDYGFKGLKFVKII